MGVGIYINFTTGLDSKRLKDVILEWSVYHVYWIWIIR